MDQFPPIDDYIAQIFPKKEPLVLVKWSVGIVIHVLTIVTISCISLELLMILMLIFPDCVNYPHMHGRSC